VHEKDKARPSASHARAHLFHGDAPLLGPFSGEACERDSGRLEARRDDRFGRPRPRLRRAQSRDRKRIPGAKGDEAANDANEKD
jgi:hypothetical protein